MEYSTVTFYLLALTVAFFSYASPRFTSFMLFWTRVTLTVLLVALACVVGLLVAVYCSLVPNEHGNTNFYTGIMLRYFLCAPIFPFKFDIRAVTGCSQTDEDTSVPLLSSFDIDTLMPSPCVYICNHQSMLDILTMSRMWPRHVSVLAKSTLRFYPFIGWYMMLAGAIFIRRRDKSHAFGTINDSANQIQSKQLGVFLFPEGTRSDLANGQMLPFKKGAFHMAIKAKVPIVPVVFSRYDPVFKMSAFKILPVLPQVHLPEYLDHEGMEDVIAKCYADMQTVLDRIKSTPDL